MNYFVMMHHSEKAWSLLVYALRYMANRSGTYASKWVQIVLPVAFQDLVMLMLEKTEDTCNSAFDKHFKTLQKD
jgi:hypothetical protein